MLFSEDITKMRFNLKTVMIDSYPQVISSLERELARKGSSFPLLQSLVISGGSVHSDSLVSDIKELTRTLSRACPNLENLHLPVTSNSVLYYISWTRIKAFKSDRTKSLDREGLYHLCKPGRKSREHLQVLHLGVFVHAHFEKQDVAKFVKQMTTLREFSLLDKDRALLRLEAKNIPGDKVLTYSTFKLAIRDSEERLVTGLTSMTVVDRSLKPFYLLESAPLLTRLGLDWQQELSFPPFNRFSPDWFSTMLRTDPSWVLLAERLTHLDLTFPSAHSINSYSLPLEDFTKLMESLSNLQELRLEGAGQGGPIPLIAILNYCPRLKVLTLDNTPVHVPDNYESVDQRFVSSSIRRFSFLGEMSSLLVHNYMTTGIALYMPHLEELEVRERGSHRGI